MLPTTKVPLGEKEAGKIMALMEALEEHDDVKSVYANFDIPDSILAQLGQS